jgi:hypothetical protein
MKEKEQIIKAINGYEINYSNIPIHYWLDEDVLKSAVKKGGVAIQYLSQEQLNNTELLLDLIKINMECIKHLDYSQYRNNKEFMMRVLEETDGSCIQFAGKSLRSDCEFVLKSIKNSTSLIRFASEVLTSDRDFILSLVAKDGSVFNYASEELRNDKELIIFALQNTKNSLYIMSSIGDEIKKDKEFILKLIKMNFEVYEYLEDLKSDWNIIINCLAQDHKVVIKIDKDYFKNKSLEQVFEFVQSLSLNGKSTCNQAITNEMFFEAICKNKETELVLNGFMQTLTKDSNRVDFNTFLNSIIAKIEEHKIKNLISETCIVKQKGKKF